MRWVYYELRWELRPVSPGQGVDSGCSFLANMGKNDIYQPCTDMV